MFKGRWEGRVAVKRQKREQGQKEGSRVEATEIYWERKLENGTRPVATGWGRGIVRFPI